MSQITSHILDTSKGKPAAGIEVILYRQQENDWHEMAKNSTDDNGRAGGLVGKDEALLKGVYKLKFLTADYFNQMNMNSFYPYIEVVFEVSSNEHYHIPLLLNPYGYSTYRGS